MSNRLLALDVWTDPRRRALELSKLWQEFLSGNPHDEHIRPDIIASWRRCLEYGVHPQQTQPSRSLSEKELEERWQAHPLAAYLAPVINELSVLAGGSGHLVVVTDGSGQILRLVGDRPVHLAAERMNFVLGSHWGEAAAGTNAIGTALAERHPIQIFAAEHFCEPVHKWTCSAAPILDPATGDPLAVIDLTGFREVVHPHTLAAVITAAQTVERQLRDRLQQQQLHLAERFLDAVTRNPRWDLAAIDCRGGVVRAAPAFYNEGWVDANGHLEGSHAKDLVTLCPEGWEAYSQHGSRRFELRPVFQGDRLIGALVRMAPVGSSVTHRTAETAPAPKPENSFASLLGSAPAFRAAIVKAAQYAASSQPVMIDGESGTGKELLAQAVHMASPRTWGPFIAVNCGAIPKDLVASEFFGYERGTFTGAAREGRIGKFEAASGGTIFLDEIGEMPLDAQVYLLRVLEQGEVVRLGAKTPVKVDVRVIAATNRNLADAVLQGNFRQDLYYRLNVLSVRMPLLRERPDDIPLLMQHFMQRACRELGRVTPTLSAAALERLTAYRWPGNVRELRNLAYRLAHTVSGSQILLDDLPPEIGVHLRKQDAGAGAASSSPAELAPARDRSAADVPVALVRWPELERIAFEQAWQRHSGHAALVAKVLGISRATAYRKANQLGLLHGSERRLAKEV